MTFAPSFVKLSQKLVLKSQKELSLRICYIRCGNVAMGMTSSRQGKKIKKRVEVGDMFGETFSLLYYECDEDSLEILSSPENMRIQILIKNVWFSLFFQSLVKKIAFFGCFYFRI